MKYQRSHKTNEDRIFRTCSNCKEMKNAYAYQSVSYKLEGKEEVVEICT